MASASVLDPSSSLRFLPQFAFMIHFKLCDETNPFIPTFLLVIICITATWSRLLWMSLHDRLCWLKNGEWLNQRPHDLPTVLPVLPLGNPRFILEKKIEMGNSQSYIISDVKWEILWDFVYVAQILLCRYVYLPRG